MRWLRKRPQGRDRRRQSRYPVEEAGLVLVPGTEEGQTCNFRDISQDGAGVLLTGDVPLPHEVTLVMPDKSLTARARIVWQDGKWAGLQLLARY